MKSDTDGGSKINIRIITLLVAVALIATAITAFIISNTSEAGTTRDAKIRQAPYPYRSMLAICSDIDGSTLREFEAYHRFLNTYEETEWGTGVGLDIADTFWMFAMNNDGAVHDYDGSGNESIMTYFADADGNKKYADKIVHYFKSGWIDGMHSFGDFSQVDEKRPIYNGDYGKTAFDAMKNDGLLPSIWINHGNAANLQNVRNPGYHKKGLSYQQGGNSDSEFYHTDYTIAGGLKYFWFSLPSDEFSVESPLFPVTLQDGQKVWGFDRYTGEGKNLRPFSSHIYNWSIYTVNEQLSEEHLEELVSDNGVAVVAQHLGTSNGDYILPAVALDAFRRLAEYEKSNDILVARTSRLLEYVRVRDNLIYENTTEGDIEIFDIQTVDDPILGIEQAKADNLKGISFNVESAKDTKILINGKEVDESLLVRSANDSDEQVVGFKWYEKDVTDYTVGNGA